MRTVIVIVVMSMCLSDLAWSQQTQPQDLMEQLKAMKAEMERMQWKMSQMEEELKMARVSATAPVPADEVAKEVAKILRVEEEKMEGKKGPAFSKWDLQLDAMWMDLKGLDEYTYDVVGVDSRSPTGLNNNRRSSNELDVSSRPTFRGELGYRLNDTWRIGVSGWSFGSDKSANRRISNVVLRRVNGEGYIDYRARQEFDVWTIDLFATRNFVDGKKGFLDMNFGTKVGRPEHEVLLSQDGYNIGWTGTGDTEGILTWESREEAHYSLLAGPSMGLQGRFNICGPVRFEGFINQSALMGKVHQRGHSSEVGTNIAWVGPKANGVQGSTVTTTDIAPFKKSKSVLIPVTEMKAKFLFDITKNVAFDLGGFFSQWWDMPVAPDMTRDLGGNMLGWVEREKTPRFVGVSFGFSLQR